jgi:hypothetical protein
LTIARHCLGKDRAEVLLVGGDESSSLGVAIRFSCGFDQSLIGDRARCGELAALDFPQSHC